MFYDTIISLYIAIVNIFRKEINDNALKLALFAKIPCNQIKYIELGINDYNRPLGVFLFVGATGVGKTETAKQIAKQMKYGIKTNATIRLLILCFKISKFKRITNIKAPRENMENINIDIDLLKFNYMIGQYI